MKLDTEFIKLPLRFDAQRLSEEVGTLSEADWKAHPQGFAGNSAISLISVTGDPATDAVAGPNRPTPYLARLPYVQQVLASLDAPLGRTRLMRIASKSEASAHVDSNYYWLQRVRVHIPVVTWPSVEFLCGERTLHMAAGECWLFDTWRLHNVLNPAALPRIHLVADTVGSDRFWELVDDGERPFAAQSAATVEPRFVPYRPDDQVALATEMVNFPVVMTPWEQADLLRFLLDDARQSERNKRSTLARLESTLRTYQRRWHGLWARYGDDPSGWEAYQSAREDLKSSLKPLEGLLHFPNGTEATTGVLRAVFAPALNPQLANRRTHVHPAPAKVPAQPSAESAEKLPSGSRVDLVPSREHVSRLDRPVIILAAPRSGSTLLFETLAHSPDVWTIGSESHGVFERQPTLSPSQRDFQSNRLTADDATPELTAEIRAEFLAKLRDRDGRPLAPGDSPIRMLEKTPKNALRVEFLNAVFPDALFVYLFREPEENLASIIEAWTSGRFVTYADLPGWKGLPWSLLLIPSWQELSGRPLEEIAAAQYAAAHEHILSGLEALPGDRWTAISYAQLTAEPQAAMERLCDFAGLNWDQVLRAGELPLSRHTLTPPHAEKWHRHEAEIVRVLPSVQVIATRGRRTVEENSAAETPETHHTPRSMNSTTSANTTAQQSPPTPAADIRCVNTASFPALLQQLGISLAVTTYQAGKLILLRTVDGKLNAHFRNFQMPMGLAANRRRLVLGSKLHVWEFRNQPEVGRKMQPPGKYDACYLPRRSHVTGDIRIHEIAFAEDELWIVNTRFSCLCTLDGDYSFSPRWRPPFVTALAPEDRCHLNGLGIAEGRPKYVTCHAASDEEAGWRQNKADSGCILDVDSGRTLLSGLSMPHSPRYYDHHLWVLESGNGSLARVDLESQRLDTVVKLPGFTRGLDFHGRYAFVGLSQVRESAVFSGIPITESDDPRHCGVWVIDVTQGSVAGFLRFDAGVQEIFAVQVLPGIRCPELILDDEAILANSFVIPQDSLREVPAAVLS